MHLHTLFLILSLFAFFVAMAVTVSARRLKFFGYQGIAKDVDRLSRALGAETYRHGDDLVVKGNWGQAPVLVRFSLAKNSSSVNIALDAPANFQMTVAPASAHQGEGTKIRTQDGIFDSKFTTSSRQPMVARMFLSRTGTMPLVKKLCLSSSTSLRIDSGKLEMRERPFEGSDVFDYVQRQLKTMESLAENLRAMPGADAIRIVPFRKSGSRFLKPAVALGLSFALFQASRLSGEGATQAATVASGAAVQDGALPADAAGILYLQGWRLAQVSDFDADAKSWLRGQDLAPSATIHGNFSGKDTGRDAAYVLVDKSGIMRVVVLSEGKVSYDQRYQRVLVAARVPASSLATTEWREAAPGQPDGDGLLLVTKLGSPFGNPGSSVILTLRGGKPALTMPVDYEKVRFF
jgi:hypothetical protein